MQIGLTFPSHEFQGEFLRHLSKTLIQTPFMMSVDSAEVHGPFRTQRDLLDLPFGTFDDSFNQKQHSKWNEPNWDYLGRTRWQRAPAGGEFSFFEPRDQSEALAPNGPHGVSFEDHARRFHMSFILGDAQPWYQKPERIREASLAMGYRFRVTEFLAGATGSRVQLTNSGIAPLYHDAWPAVNGVRATESLKGLLPGDTRAFEMASGGNEPKLTIASDRLSPGQVIEFDADL
jgi:hypothetical protein